MIKNVIEKLTAHQGDPCVSISLNTHRLHPDNQQDAIVLKNLVREATERVTDLYGKRDVKALLEKLDSLPDQIDVNYNLDSLHIFLSNEISEIVKSPWPVAKDHVDIATSFGIRPLIKAYNRTADYLLMVLSQGGVNLYHAQNDAIVAEIRNDDFPFSETRHYHTDQLKISDPKAVDHMVREFLNRVDKAAIQVYNEWKWPIVLIATEDNYARLMQVADRPQAYVGYAAIDYNDTAPHTLAAQGWGPMQEELKKQRAAAIEELQEAVGQGKVLTDLQEIYRASLEGRGELLIANQDFMQPALLNPDGSMEPVADPADRHATEDVVSDIAWNVISMGGRAVFTGQEALLEIGEVVLKTRY